MSTLAHLVRRVPRAALVGGLATLLLVAALLSFVGGSQTRTVTAHFDRAVQLYTGSEVRILGVPVGEVTAVVPEGETVRVDMTYDSSYDVPADAHAAIITPTLTADRFVQLTPAYSGGPVLEDGATIEVEDTATPVELDRIYRSLNDLTRALGPNGVNRDGTLDNVLGAGAKFLDGNGRKANDTIVALSQAAETFGDNSGELFATVRDLDEFTGALAANDAAVARFIQDLGSVSQQLAGEKEELAAALGNLAAILDKVERFVADNREQLNASVADLAEILQVVGAEKKALETVLDVGPSSLGNLHIAFDPGTDTIGSRLQVQNNVVKLDQLLCHMVGTVPSSEALCQLFEQLVGPATAQSAGTSQPPSGSGASARQVRYGDARSADDLSELIGGRA